MIKVTSVEPESIAQALGLQAGTELLSVNGRELESGPAPAISAINAAFTRPTGGSSKAVNMACSRAGA